MASKIGRREGAAMGGEEYLKGRRAGVEGSYGQPGRGVAERTVIPRNDGQDSGGEGDLQSTATKLYQDAVHNRGDKIGDRALTER